MTYTFCSAGSKKQEDRLPQSERATNIALSYGARHFDMLNRLKAFASIIVSVEINLSIK